MFQHPIIFNDQWKTINLFSEWIDVNKGHVSIINDFKKYKRANGAACILCQKRNASPSYLHVCVSGRPFCRRCNRTIAPVNSTFQEGFSEIYFCDSETNPTEFPKTCEKCLFEFKSSNCLKLHRSIACSRKRFCPYCKRKVDSGKGHIHNCLSPDR